jgi:N-6 DNA Methylase
MALEDRADDVVTSTQIARLANVSRAAVSNWRRRYPEFPKPVGGSPSSPTFSWSSVEAWLAVTSKGEQLRTEGQTSTGTQRLDLIRSPGGPAASTEAQRLEDAAHWWHEAQSRGSEANKAWLASLVLPTTMAALLPAATDGPVLDPSCGTGARLFAVAERFGPLVTLYGQSALIEQAQAALGADGAGVAHLLRTGDSLSKDQIPELRGLAAAVVCEVPPERTGWDAAALADDPRWLFGLPAARDSDLAWVQHCYAYLRPNATAVIALSPQTCIHAEGRQIRAALVRAGALDAVITLPSGLGVEDGEVCLWILRRPYGRPDHAVLMVDLTRDLPTSIPAHHSAWKAVFADPSRSCTVAGIELLDDDVSLLPARYLTRIGGETADAYTRATSELPRLLEMIARALPRFETGHGSADRQMVHLGELERTGSLSFPPRGAVPKIGDVLLRSGGRAPVVVSDDNNDEAHVQIIAIRADRLDPHFVAAFLQADASVAQPTSTLGVLSRDDLRRCRIPRMPAAEQRRYGDAFRNLQGFEDALRSTTELSATVLRSAAYALITGELAPPG